MAKATPAKPERAKDILSESRNFDLLVESILGVPRQICKIEEREFGIQIQAPNAFLNAEHVKPYLPNFLAESLCVFDPLGKSTMRSHENEKQEVIEVIGREGLDFVEGYVDKKGKEPVAYRQKLHYPRGSSFLAFHLPVGLVAPSEVKGFYHSLQNPSTDRVTLAKVSIIAEGYLAWEGSEKPLRTHGLIRRTNSWPAYLERAEPVTHIV